MQSRLTYVPILLLAAVGTACGEPNVPPEVDVIEVAAPKTRLLVGETVRFTAVAKARSGEVLADRRIVWTSEHPDVATINEQGWIDAKRRGFARIVATSEYRRTEVELGVAERNPAPVIREIQPAVVQATQRPPFVLTVYGDGFTEDSRIRVGRFLRATGFVSRTELNTEITSTEIEGGSPEIRVETPSPGGGVSQSLVLTSVQPAPTIDGVQPATLPMSGGVFNTTITLTGNGFTRATQLYVNGQPRGLDVKDSSSIKFRIFPGERLAPGVIPIRIVNPAPGGGTSSTAVIIEPAP